MGASRDAPPLRILLQFLRAREAGDPFAFRFEPQEYILPTEGGDSPTARFEWTPEVMADLEAVRRPGRDPEVIQRLGSRLRRFVGEAGWSLHEGAITQALDGGREVVLTLRSSAAELYSLPWELLPLKSGMFLGELEGLLLRCEWPESPSQREGPSPRAEGGRILFAWSAAGGAVPAAEHAGALATACVAGAQPWNAGSDILAQASLERLVQRLKEARDVGPPIHVLHLLCHGGPAGSGFGLCLDGRDGAVAVDAQQLRRHLAPFAGMVRLIVLAACDSANAGALGSQLGSVAQSLHRCGFQAVIASRYPLSVEGSCMLTAGFYQHLLGEPASVESAFLAARQQLALAETGQAAEQRRLDWASLQLYARHGDGDDTRPIVFRPYRGLLAFQPEDQRFFFGREREIREVLTDLQALISQGRARFLIVAGGSGTGKSSLVLAGAVPKLLAADPALRFMRMRPGSDPQAALRDALSNWQSGTAGLLLVDQLEEIFTQTDSPAQRESFVARLWELASEPGGLRILLTLRVDFIPRCGELFVDAQGLRLDRVAYDERHRIFVSLPEPAQLRAAIVEPARQVGLSLQAGLADRILAEVGREPGALPLLQDALTALWQGRDGNQLTQDAYDALGGVVGALEHRADALLGSLATQGDLAVAQRLLVSLVAVADDTALDTRLRVPLSELRAAVDDREVASFDRVLKELVSAQLLVMDGDAQTATVEVAHEALIRKWPRLRTWLAEDRAGLVMRRRVHGAAQAWQAQGGDESLLYRGLQLAQAQEWRQTWNTRIGTLERTFLAASEALRQRLADEEAERQRREAEAIERIKQKSIEARDALLLAVAGAHRDDPTTAATLLREVQQPGSRLWLQLSLDTLQAAIAERVLRGHESYVYAVAVSPDGSRIATASADHTLRIWDALRGEPLQVRQGHTDIVLALCYSPDGRRLASGSADGTIRIWSTDDSSEPLVLKGSGEWIKTLAFSPDSRRLAVGSGDLFIRIWTMEADGIIRERVLQGHGRKSSCVAFSPDGKRLVSASDNGCVYLWDVGEGAGEGDATAAPRVLKGHESWLNSVAFRPDGKRLVTGANDGTIRIWDLEGAEPTASLVLKGHSDAVYSVAFSPDGSQVVSGSGDKTARIWSADGRESPRLLGGHRGVVTSVAFCSNGQGVVTGSLDRTARLFGVRAATDPVGCWSLTAGVIDVALSRDGGQVACVCSDGRTYVFLSDRTGDATQARRWFDDKALAVEFSRDGSSLITFCRDTTAHIWDLAEPGPPRVITGLGKGDQVRAIARLSDGTMRAAGIAGALAWVANLDGSEPRLLQGHREHIFGIRFSPDGLRLVTCSQDGTARVFATDGSAAPVVLQGHSERVFCAAFSPDGKKVVTGSRDRTARVFSADG
ncbi:MAG TPA: CHAT domain-containing protein, partial [Pseudomonadota bacterium]|nr:CHAT domain-containing protein [Pseudomonadota bacterium]